MVSHDIEQKVSLIKNWKGGAILKHTILHYVRVQRSRGVSKDYKAGVKGYLEPVLQSAAEEPKEKA